MGELYDPNDEITTYLEKKQDARYRLIELKQACGDPIIIRATLIGLEAHAEWLRPVDKFREFQDEQATNNTEATWEQCKTHIIKWDVKLNNNPATKKAMGIANTATMKKF